MRIFLSFLLLILAIFAQAQDPRLNQFQFQKLELNPAYAGHSGNGMLLFNLASRTSFHPVRGPFTYSTTAIDFSPCKLENIGIGFLVNKESQGDGYYTRTRVGINLGGALKISEGISLGYGFRPGFIQQAINWDEFTFSDQLDPLNGISRPSFNHGTPLDLSTTINGDAGIKLNFYKKGRSKIMIGLSGFNLTQPKIGLLSRSTLNRRYSLHGSQTSNGLLNKDNKHITNFRVDFQGDNRFFAINHEIILNFKGIPKNKLGCIFGVSTPFSSQSSNDININFLSAGGFYQFNPSTKLYFSYEKNIGGKSINGKTSSIEIGIIISTTSSTCEYAFKDAFEFKSNEKISKPLGCPPIAPNNGKIENF